MPDDSTSANHDIRATGIPGIERLLPLALQRAGAPVGEIASVIWQPMNTGYSGAHLTRAHVTARPAGSTATWRTSLIIKRIHAAGGWLGWATEDHEVREAQLWRAGILDRLPHGIASAVLLAEQHLDADGAIEAGTLIMRDMRAHLLRQPYRAPHASSPLLVTVLDALARLHAAFWQDPSLLDPGLGLVRPGPMLCFAAPATIAQRLAMGDSAPYLREIPPAWDTFFAHIPTEARLLLLAALENSAPLVDAISNLPFTLVHGDTWGPNLAMWRVSRNSAARALVLLDWGLASAAPCTYDPLWLCATWPTLGPASMMAVYRARLKFHLACRGVRLAQPVWRRLLDVGYLRTVMAGGEAFGHTLQQARTPAARGRAQRVATWWALRAAAAAQRLSQAHSATGTTAAQQSADGQGQHPIKSMHVALAAPHIRQRLQRRPQ